jgi:hypothetical protein
MKAVKRPQDLFTWLFPLRAWNTIEVAYQQGLGLSGITERKHYKAMKELQAFLKVAIKDAEKVYRPEVLQ